MDIAAPTLSEFSILEKDTATEETVITAFKSEYNEIESCRENIEFIDWEQPRLEEFIVPHEDLQVDIVPAGEILATKKRKKTPTLWKTTLRRQKRESGQMYISTKNKIVPGRALKKPCSNCIYNCTNIFSVEERTQIFQSFWTLADDEKNHFYTTFVTRNCVKRRKKDCDNSIKQFSYKYFFEKSQSLRRVCRVFFLNTLCIDQKRIYYSFTHLKNKVISSKPKDTMSEVEEHLSSSPAIDSRCSRETVSSAIKILLPRKRKKNLTCKAYLKRPRIEMGQAFVSNENEEEHNRNLKVPKPIQSNILSTCKAHLQRPKTEIGEESVSINNELEHGRILKEPCSNCSLQCANIFTSDERTKIFQLFWSLSDEEKYSFYSTFVATEYVKRRRKNSSSCIKQYSYKYFFEKNQSLYRVCRVFFLNTLGIDQNRIYYCFKYLRNQVKCSALQRRNKKILKLKTVTNIIKSENPEQILSSSEVGSQYCNPRAIVPAVSGSLLARKRNVNTSLWKINLRKMKREPEQTYIPMKREIVSGRTLRKPCNSCPYNCTNIFSTEERIHVFQSFWNLSGDEKITFYKKFVIRDSVKRRKKNSQSDIKQFSYKYFLEKNQSLHRVCRVFFLNTLCIDQKRIYYSFKHLKNNCKCSPPQRSSGTTAERIITPKKTVKIEDHLISISALRTHYCNSRLPSTDEPLPTKEGKKIIQKPKSESEQTIAVTKIETVACTDVKESIQKQNEESEQTIGTIKNKLSAGGYIKEKPNREAGYDASSKIAALKGIKERLPKLNSEVGQLTESTKSKIAACKGIKDRRPKPSGRSIKEPCKNCPFDCANIFTTDDRLHIFQSFWRLSGDGKTCFYNKFVMRDNVKRRKKDSQSDIKQFSYRYFLEKNQCFYRVCRVFFLNTLSIDQKRIYYSFNHLTNRDADPLL